MQIGWIDFSRSDRNKVLNVVQLLSEPGAIDELGFGSIRDAFANYFFPGTSTIQTRAKYFFIIPYIMHQIMHDAGAETLYWNPDKAVAMLHDMEWQCCRKLTERYKNETGKLVGIIGYTQAFEKRWVIRKPSDIYWNGIKILHLLNAETLAQQKLSIRDCLRQGLSITADRLEQKKSGKRSKTDENDEADDLLVGERQYHKMWNVEVPKNWMDNLQIDLSETEATTLRRLIAEHYPDSVFNLILQHNIDLGNVEGLDFKYVYDQINRLDETTDETRSMLHLASQFSRFVYAARIVYNRIYSAGNLGVDEWEEIEPELTDISQLDIDALMASTGIFNEKLKRFLKELKTAYANHDYDAIVDIIKRREVQLKGARAKLPHPVSGNDVWIGGRMLDYRTLAVKQIISDIYNHV